MLTELIIMYESEQKIFSSPNSKKSLSSVLSKCKAWWKTKIPYWKEKKESVVLANESIYYLAKKW